MLSVGFQNPNDAIVFKFSVMPWSIFFFVLVLRRKDTKMGGYNGALIGYGFLMSYKDWKIFEKAWFEQEAKNAKMEIQDEIKEGKKKKEDQLDSKDQEDEGEGEEEGEDDEDELAELGGWLNSHVSYEIPEWVRINRDEPRERPYPEEVFIYLSEPSHDTRSCRTGIYTHPPVWSAEKVKDSLFAPLTQEQLDPLTPVRDLMKKLNFKPLYVGDPIGWYVIVHTSD